MLIVKTSSVNARMKANNAPRVALEECAPNVFIVHDIRVRPFLQGEGERDGNRFVLTSWRRDGLFARLRERGLDVSTFASQIHDLPALPPVTVPDLPPRWYRLGHADERWSMYDPATRQIGACVPDTTQSQAGVWLTPGAVVRRRRGRGAGEWYAVTAQGADALQFRHLSDDDAILAGLAQASCYDHAPLQLIPTAPDQVILVTPILPVVYQRCAGRWATSDRHGTTWQLQPAQLPLMHQLLARLAIAVAL